MEESKDDGLKVAAELKKVDVISTTNQIVQSKPWADALVIPDSNSFKLVQSGTKNFTLWQQGFINSIKKLLKSDDELTV
jgi:hypothetical protein